MIEGTDQLAGEKILHSCLCDMLSGAFEVELFYGYTANFGAR